MNFRMSRFAKQIVWVAALALLVLGRESARGFALEGPIGNGPDSYQTSVIGYGLPRDLSAEKEIGQEYRRNTPVMYYAADVTFWNYFGAEGMNAVDQAYAVLNGLTNVDLYSTNLTEFPLQSQRVNPLAAALFLTDLKSVTLGIMMEQLGLFQPVRSVWALRDRYLLPGTSCPAGEVYDVIKRNIDIAPDASDTFQYSSYVNGTLYSYYIYENCGAALPNADAVEFPVSPLVDPPYGDFTAVADMLSFGYDGISLYGGYYTGITRDDMAGLRYLITTNNYNLESTGPGTVQFTTNAPAIITNMDLALFSANALTNGPVALAVLYPGLVITTTTNTFGLLVATNITETLTKSPYDPPSFPPTHPSYSTNYTTNVIATYEYTFGNIVTNSFATRGLVGTITLGLTNSPYSPAGTPATIVTNAKLSYVNGTFGSFFLLPTNLCGVQILSNLLTQVIATTNFPATNTLAATGVTNAITFTPGTITFFTNSIVLYLPVTCPEDTVATRQGVGQLTFLRRDFDSLLNQFWDPVTNDYTMYVLTNGFIVPQHIERAVTTPDFLFQTTDSGITPSVYQRNVNFNDVNVPTNAAGPGTIETPTSIVLNNTGPLYVNAYELAAINVSGGFFLEGTPLEGTQTNLIIWGSFDGTTNAPIVYPNGTSILQMEQMLLGPFIVTTSLPNGAVNAAYSASLTGTGGQPPYTWSMSPGSGLPTGLTLSTTGQITGTPTGPPDLYDVTIRITDSNGAFNDIPFTITIDP